MKTVIWTHPWSEWKPITIHFHHCSIECTVVAYSVCNVFAPLPNCVLLFHFSQTAFIYYTIKCFSQTIISHPCWNFWNSLLFFYVLTVKKKCCTCLSLCLNFPPAACRLSSNAWSSFINTNCKSFCSRICLAPLMTSPQGQSLVWAQRSAPAAPPAAAVVAKGSKEAPVTRDSPLSPPTPPHTSTARGAGPLPPLWARLQAPLSPSSPDQALGPSLLPVDPLPTPPHQVEFPSDPLKVCTYASW